MTQKDDKTSSIKVFVRVRPLVGIQSSTINVVQLLNDNKTIKVSNDNFNYFQVKVDHVFNNNCSQQDVYQKFQDIIPKVKNGFNITIFAYGQTGSGKTYTMFGYNQQNQLGTTINHKKQIAGVIPRAINQVFSQIKRSKNAQIYCSFLQIYNQKIFDLLQDGQKPKPLSIHESKVQGIFVQGLTQFGIQNSQDCFELLRKGLKNRTIRQTSMNAKSSRSHSIFQIIVQIQQQNGNFLKSKLNLCDLAGSQKINKKQAMGNQQLQQLKNINLSLTTLGKVIYSLSTGDKKALGAFRQSKLTRLLQDSLTNNTFTFILGNLSPSSKNIQQTISTLKFVERANHITMKIKPTQFNGHNPDSVIKLQKQVQYLKQLLNLKKQGINPEQVLNKLNNLKSEKQKKEELSKQQFQKLVYQNRQMKKQIHNLQVKLEATQGTQSSLDSVYFQKRQKQKEKHNYYMPSEKDSRNSAKSKLSNSLVQAGKHVINNKNTIDESPNRAKQKQNLAKRLQQIQDKKRYQERLMLDQFDELDKIQRYKSIQANNKNNKNKVPKKQQMVLASVKSKKKIDYSEKIKQLQARLFGR